MAVITVQMHAGRTDEQKRGLVLAITDAMVEHTGASREHIYIVINETSPENWAVRGEWCPDYLRQKKETKE